MADISEVMMKLIKCAVTGTKIEQKMSDDELAEIFETAYEHDLAHLVGYALKNSGLPDGSEMESVYTNYMMAAVYRYEKINHELSVLCDALEKAKIPFMPLKGAVIRQYYPEPWMRTSCDIDVLVHNEDLEAAIEHLQRNLNYTGSSRGSHDVCMNSPSGVHVELHFDLVEEGRANNAIKILGKVWDTALLCEDSDYRYEMPDDFFYFYHIVHMAKHFEDGGCGIRPFMDILILDNMPDADIQKRDKLLDKGKLLKFANVCRRVSRVWFEDECGDELTGYMQNYILSGGSYGTTYNRVAFNKKHGFLQYMISRAFAPYSRLKRYYPILEKHAWLMPFMQVRRWCMLLKPGVRNMAKGEMAANNSISEDKLAEAHALMKNIGLR